MALFKRKTRTPKGQLSDEESMARYVYLLNTLPPSVIEHAHETAFRELPEAKRREMYERLVPFMSEDEKTREAEPSLLARVMQRVSAGAPVGDPVTARVGRDARPTNMWPFSDPMLGPLVAMHFLMSSNITSYFTVGAGSVGLASEPAWVGDLGGLDASAGAGDMGMGSMGGGFDGGGIGFDGGGGGFDGGGGF
jgi:hypothetical protein